MFACLYLLLGLGFIESRCEPPQMVESARKRPPESTHPLLYSLTQTYLSSTVAPVAHDGLLCVPRCRSLGFVRNDSRTHTTQAREREKKTPALATSEDLWR